MSITLTSLYEILPKKCDSKADLWQSHFVTLKDVLTKNGFEKLTSSSQQQNGHPGQDEVVTECYCHHKNGRTILVTCCKDSMMLDLNERTQPSRLSEYNECAEQLQTDLYKALRDYNINRVPTIRRGEKIWQYSECGDGRIAENNFTELLFDKTSEYQRVTIGYTKTYGKILLLDWVENLAESDDSYTTSLCGIDRGVTYQDKSVLILGGGDGAALHCLRKLNPRMITMIEIDEMVLNACRTHLRSCCGDSLDKYEGENYKIIVGDCIKYLEEYAREGRKFDYVISDITDVPIETNEKNNQEIKESWLSGAGWKFFKQVFNYSLKLVETDGIIMTHITASLNVDGIKRFEVGINNLDEEVDYEMFDEFVPSFCEKWMFCHIKKRTAQK
uniref:Spermine synthase-like n=1 Tax=Phallusia mammillata TaxID=59560 RepID=A0A6F9DTS1_9ASCI|nr:spermine synthase-like [Phallusia mammillata]